jgi:hypothetical protein
MTYPCETVLDRIASGEPLGVEERAHVAGCVDCARLARVPGLLASAASEPEPGPGFSSRMQIGARGRIAARRRNRIAVASFAAAAALTAGGLAVTRPSTEVDRGAILTLEHSEPQPRPPVTGEVPSTDEQVVLDLARVSQVERSLSGEADWTEITEPLAPYRYVFAKRGIR